MVKLRRITEATDSSHTSIMYNLADNLVRKGYDATLTDKGIRVNFKFDKESAFDPKATKDGKEWLKNNKDKDFVFKGWNLDGSFIWDIVKNDAGRRELVTKDVRVKGDNNLLTLQKKLPVKDAVNGKLTGRSVKPFVYPEPYTITNLATPTFQSYLRKLRDQIVTDVALALSEVIEKPAEEEKKESTKYYIDYDENFTRVNEGYITEADNKEEKSVSWKDDDVQKAITDAVKGLEINKSKTTDKELIFKYNDKNGSIHLQGYMLVLDTDTDDEIPPTSYPVKDRNNLTIENLLDTIKTVFSRRSEALNVSESEKEDTKESKKESHLWDDDVQSDELTPVKPEPTFYILSGDPEDPSVGVNEPTWDEIIGDENGYIRKEDAIAKAKEIAKQKNLKYTVYGVTKDPVDIMHFMNDTFWDAVDDNIIEVEVINIDEPFDTVSEKRLDEEVVEVDEAVEDHIDGIPEPNIHTSVVFQDVAKERFRELLNLSLLVAPDYEGECIYTSPDFGKKVVWVYLSPSYALSQLTDIVLPICLDGRKVSLPIADIPDYTNVFGDNQDEANLSQYKEAVQKYLLTDAPLSDIIELDLDNTDIAKAMIVDAINTMAEDYQDKKSQLESSLDLTGESLLKESRYFIVPADTDLTGEVEKLNSIGYTDLNAAKLAMKELADSGQFNFDLSILDTNFSNNKDKWALV